MLFSLLFPFPPIETTRLSSINLKQVSSILNDRSHTNNKNRSLNFSCFSLHKSHVLTTSATNLVVEEEEEEQKSSNVRLKNDAGFSAAEEHSLPAGLQREFIPNHVAMIMDGNVRWARHRGLPSSLGHEAGVRTLREVIELCHKWGIRVLTVFAFSHDNWIRPQMEVDFLMRLFERGLNKEMENFMRKDIRVSVIGDSSKLPISLQKLINKAKETTKNNLGLQLIVAVSYSGRYDIVQACKGIAEKVKDGLIKPEDINESLINEELETNCTDFPYPDLLIRTSGELRVSNFMLWQLAYTELFFVRSLWPDFGEDKFIEALHSFQQRQRRYGGRDS